MVAGFDVDAAAADVVAALFVLLDPFVGSKSFFAAVDEAAADLAPVVAAAWAGDAALVAAPFAIEDAAAGADVAAVEALAGVEGLAGCWDLLLFLLLAVDGALLAICFQSELVRNMCV